MKVKKIHLSFIGALIDVPFEKFANLFIITLIILNVIVGILGTVEFFKTG